MPRNGSGVYTLAAGYEATTGQTATAAQHNDPLVDLETDMNTARPIVAGGTGADTAEGARVALEIDPTIQVFTASGTYTPTAGARWAVVEVVGGGGGGGDASTTSSGQGGAGSGGGAGRYIKSDLIDVSGASYTSTITIGAGGAAGAAGGDTTYADGTITLTAGGGTAGASVNDSANFNMPDAGNGGSETATGHTPVVSTTGGAGERGMANIDGNGRSMGGAGAPGMFGGDAKSSKGTTDNSATAGNAATGYGGGGGGAASRGTGASAGGGAGSDGIIIITEFA